MDFGFPAGPLHMRHNAPCDVCNVTTAAAASLFAEAGICVASCIRTELAENTNVQGRLNLGGMTHFAA